MTHLRPISSSNLIKKLRKLGFTAVRQKGSHIFFRHPDGRSTVVPHHKGEDVSRGLLHKILIDIETDADEFFSI